MAEFNREKCAQRNRVAAKRDKVEAVPVRFLGGASAADLPEGAVLRKAIGKPKPTDEQALEIINARRNGGELLTLDQVHIHYCEAANDNFIPDRYMFMDGSTLKNIASGANKGFAFMNSHRTGGMSTPTELPFGIAFWGRYEMYVATGEDVRRERALVGIYLMAGVHPNGSSGPSSDDLSTMIDGGTIDDVSVGLWGGDAVCDVCGEDVNEYVPGHDDENGNWISGRYSCPHVPGTTRRMDEAEQEAQIARGVPDGCCSYSLFDAYCGEVSAVFDGAVPGAGFRKLLGLAKLGQLAPAAIDKARHVYRSLLRKGDLPIMGRNLANLATDEEEAIAETIAQRIFGRFGPRRDYKEGETGEREEGRGKREQFLPPQVVDPRIEALDKAGVKSVGDFVALQEQAKLGADYLTDLREKCKAAAIAAYGVDTPEGLKLVNDAKLAIDGSGIDVVKALHSQYAAMAVKLGYTKPGGGAPDRNTRPDAGSTDFSKLAEEYGGGEQPVSKIDDASDIYANRRRQSSRRPAGE